MSADDGRVADVGNAGGSVGAAVVVVDSDSDAARPSRGRLLVRALTAFFVAVALAAILFQIARVVPFVGQNLAAFVAAIFIYLPVRSARRGDLDLTAYGFTTHPLRRTIRFAVVGPAIVFPLFLVVFVLFYQWACASPVLSALAPPTWCRGFIGWSGLLHPRAPADLLWAALSQVVVVALPEELFFRGYLLSLLETAFPPRHRVLGGGVGGALVLSAALFAIGHMVVGLDPRRLATFFPGLLFGWMRSATGNIAAGTFVHAASNLYIEALRRTFFA
jgi:membrane protease YdiL (CAAX protease family)